MSGHDPINFLRLLRDHLARHDRPVLFLFGAGTSSCVNIAPKDAAGKRTGFKSLIPAVVPLTEECQRAAETLGTEFKKAWGQLAGECPSGGGAVNIESILSRVRLKLQALGPTDKSCGLDRAKLEKLEACISDAILKAVNVPDADIPASLPHDKFARWAGGRERSIPIEIFTPNYDLLIELALEKALVPVYDGFAGAYRPFFLPELVEQDHMMPSSAWVRVWKIHGSVNWELSNTSSGSRICRTSSRGASYLILPSHLKYDESRKQPYLAMLGRLAKLVDREDAFLVLCGYSFSDDHINAAILGSLEKRRRAHALLLSYGDLQPDSRVVRSATAIPNLMAVGPNGAAIGGRYDTWAPTPGSDPSLSELIGDAIDLSVPASSGTAGTPVRMHLGDFNHFCSFLESMGSGSGPK